MAFSGFIPNDDTLVSLQAPALFLSDSLYFRSGVVGTIQETMAIGDVDIDNYGIVMFLHQTNGTAQVGDVFFEQNGTVLGVDDINGVVNASLGGTDYFRVGADDSFRLGNPSGTNITKSNSLHGNIDIGDVSASSNAVVLRVDDTNQRVTVRDQEESEEIVLLNKNTPSQFIRGLRTRNVESAVAGANPTNAELVTAFGAAADNGNGFIGLLDANGDNTDIFLVTIVAGSYFYQKLTAAA